MAARPNWLASSIIKFALTRISKLGMAKGKIHTDTYFMDPYPRAKFHARIPARRSERAESHAQNCYPWVSYPLPPPCASTVLMMAV